MAEPSGSESPSDRRHSERRLGIRLADLTLPELRRMLITAGLFAIVLALFLWMVRAVLIAAFLGLIIALYLRPLDRWLGEKVAGRRSSALLTLGAVIVPFVGVALYSYFEILGVARYLVANQAEIADTLAAAVRRLPWPEVSETARSAVARAARLAESLPQRLGPSLGRFAVAATIFLLTAFYVLTRGEVLAARVRARIAARYTELARGLENSFTGVLYGTVYALLVTQAIKAAVLFALNLAFGVPLAAALAVFAFVIGFFPVLGSWTVYAPAAVWLAVFRDRPVGGLVYLGVCLLVNTVFVTAYLRPRLAADRSEVLDFYWMFVGLVTGVYTFGLAGVVLGPILIGLLRAIVDTLGDRSRWRLVEPEYALEEAE